MTTVTEAFPAAAFLASESAGTRSRDAITLLSGQNLLAGAVFGRVTLGAASAVATGGNTGNGAMGAIAVGAMAQAGAYLLRITKAVANAGEFELTDPQGDVCGIGAVAAAFVGGGLSFTLADGAADFVLGDTIAITVAAGSGKAKEWNPANTDGSQIVAGVLYAAMDASTGDKAGTAIVRDAEVTAAGLVWFTGASAGNKTTGTNGLAALGIITR